MGRDVGHDHKSTSVVCQARTVLPLSGILLLLVVVSSRHLQLQGGQLLERFEHRRNWLPTPRLPQRRRVVSGDDDCNRICGNVSIPYPFGLSLECAWNSYFVLECRKTSGVTGNSGQILPGTYPYLTSVSGSYQDNGTVSQQENFLDSLQVLEVDQQSGTMVIDTTSIKASSCDTSAGNASILLPSLGPYRFGETNLFVTVGCRGEGMYSTRGPINENSTITAQCGPNSCQNQKYFEYCGLYDCCVLSVKASLDIYLLGYGILFGGYSVCGYSTILYEPSYSAFSGAVIGNGTYGAQLQWALQVNATLYPNCSMVEQSADYVCSPSPASCEYVTVGESDPDSDEYVTNPQLAGYYCQCQQSGYRGDGYHISEGCYDIDECSENSTNCAGNAICSNLPGSYNCSCPLGTLGDGWANSTGCTVIPGKSHTALFIGLSAAAAALVLIGANGAIIWWIYRKRYRQSLTEMFTSADFSRIDFLREIQSNEGANICKLFTLQELEMATNNFSIDRILGTGGFGTVFQGTLHDGTRLAIKKAKRDVKADKDDTKQFINEVTILSQVNHRNLVRLLGCCLETQVPILVYEFISNGNLQDHLYQYKQTAVEGSSGTKYGALPLNWDQRLTIAVGAARALSYLHSGTSPPIYHRDIKTANILLDDKCIAKVADFGLSRFVPIEATHLSTAVQGTPGYLDPAYFDTYQLTDKSDVYAFGVVLLELITAQKPIDLSRPAADHVLAVRCRRLLTFGLLEEIIDPFLCVSSMSDPEQLGSVHSVAQLAMRCLQKNRVDRPTMTKVLEELEYIFNSRTGKAPDDISRDISVDAGLIRGTSSGASSLAMYDKDGDSLSLLTGMSTNSSQTMSTFSISSSDAPGDAPRKTDSSRKRYSARLLTF